LRQHLTWIQNSAFEGELSEGELTRVKIGLKRLVKEDADSIIIFAASSKKWLQRDVVGIEKAEVTTILCQHL